MSNTATVQVRPVSKNGVTITPTVVTAKRGAFKGTPYPCVRIDEKETNEDIIVKQIIEWAKFRGLKRAIKNINASEALEGQTALEQAADYTEGTVKDPETNKESVVKHVQNVDSDRYWEVYISDTLRGGITIAQLEEDMEDLRGEFMETFKNFSALPPGSPEALKVMAGLTELQTEMQNIDAAIKERRRERKAKTPVAA